MVSEGGAHVVEADQYVGELVSVYDQQNQKMRHGVRQGVGVCTWANGSKYSGNWFDGMRHGMGNFTDMQGNQFEGMWKND